MRVPPHQGRTGWRAAYRQRDGAALFWRGGPGPGRAPLILGCTEIPLALDGAVQMTGLRSFNPAQVLAKTLAQRAYATA
ncbi:MAG: hypothetical protein NTZ15_12250 [Burkholderiales bacterium]|nr:hypothetical protein [Burkholderiales bacterium]